MATADIDTIRKRVVSVLNANPGTYSATVSGEVGAFPSDTEITEAIMEAEAEVVVEAYFQSINPDLTAEFNTVSDNLSNGADVPFHHGEVSLVELSATGQRPWIVGVEAQSMDDITAAIATEGYVQNGAYDFIYKMFGGQFFTPAAKGRLTYPLYERGVRIGPAPDYTRTYYLQVDENETYLMVCTTIKNLVKNASPAPFVSYLSESVRGKQQLVTDGHYTEMSEANQPEIR